MLPKTIERQFLPYALEFVPQIQTGSGVSLYQHAIEGVELPKDHELPDHFVEDLTPLIQTLTTALQDTFTGSEAANLNKPTAIYSIVEKFRSHFGRPLDKASSHAIVAGFTQQPVLSLDASRVGHQTDDKKEEVLVFLQDIIRRVAPKGATWQEAEAVIKTGLQQLSEQSEPHPDKLGDLFQHMGHVILESHSLRDNPWHKRLEQFYRELRRSNS